MENLNITKPEALSNFNLSQIQQLNHLFTFNFTTMKKQFIMMIVALFACIAVTFGQALPGSTPRPLENCTTDPLNPMAGVPYHYVAELNPTGGSAYWFATTSTQFIENGVVTPNQQLIGGDYISAATNYRGMNGQNPSGPAASPDTTTIVWNEVGLAQITPANPLFVAINYTADPANGCANNFKAFRINPVNAFLVNILNLNSPGYGEVATSCFSDIESAEYDLANSIMMYDFGKNLMAFEVVAANFTDFYNVSFRIEGMQPDQDANIYWSYTNNFADAVIIAGGPYDNSEIITGPTVETNEINTGNGVSIYVWLEVSNHNFEGLTDTPITLAVAGLNSANQPNIRWNDCAISVALNSPLSDPNAPDFAVHTLQKRPTVLPGAGLNFENQVQP